MNKKIKNSFDIVKEIIYGFGMDKLLKNKILRRHHFSFNAYEGWAFAVCKNRKVILRNFQRCGSTKGIRARDTLNPTEVKKLIGWLARYLSWSDPCPTTEAIVRTKANTRSINRQIDIISKELGT